MNGREGLDISGSDRRERGGASLRARGNTPAANIGRMETKSMANTNVPGHGPIYGTGQGNRALKTKFSRSYKFAQSLFS